MALYFTIESLGTGLTSASFSSLIMATVPIFGMIGDRLDNDIVPAKKLGMKTIWVRQGYAVYQKIDDESKRPDRIVDRIDELKLIKENIFENN